MRRIATVAVLLPLLALALPAAALAGAWTQQQGHTYNRFNADYFYSTQNFDNDANLVPRPSNGKFEAWTFTYYGELGVTDRLTLIANLPYKYQVLKDDTATNKTWGLADVDVAAKYRLLEKPVVLSVQTLVKIPKAYDMDDAVPLGNGQYDVEGRVLLGASLWRLFPGYAGLEAAYRWRDGGPADEFKFLAELGSDLWRGFYGRTKLDGTFSVGAAEQQVNPNLSFISTKYDLLKMEFTLGWNLGKGLKGRPPDLASGLDIEFTYTPYLWGRSITAGDSYSLAVAWAF
jgi:hypothetical protein